MKLSKFENGNRKGGCYLEQKEEMKGATDILVFDVDGVLIDTRDSFIAAIAETVRWSWSNLLEGDVDCDGFTSEYFNIAKKHPAFNNDVVVTWVMLRAMRRAGRKSMKEAFPSPEEWKKELDTFPPGEVVEKFAGNDTQTLPFNEVLSVFDEIYLGTEIYTECKGKARGAGGEGLWKLEAPGTCMDWKELGLPAGIYTGRSRDEMAVAFRTLAWHDFPGDMLICSDDGILKPSPEGLAILCERSGAKYPTFFGDTASDLAAWTAFGKGGFIAVGPILEAESRRGGFLHFNTLEEALFRTKERINLIKC